MEIRQEQVHGVEGEPGRDEDVGIAPPGLHRSTVPGHRLQDAHGGGADRDDASARGLGAGNRFGRLFADLAPFAVHLMAADVFHLHRQEGSRAHVQRDGGAFYPALGKARHQLIGEVEPGGGGRDRALAFSENRLVVRTVLLVRAFFAIDIGRQRRFAVTLQRRQQGFRRHGESQQKFTALLFFQDLGFEALGEHDGFARAQALGRPAEGAPEQAALGVRVLGLVQQGLHLGVLAPSAQPGGDHFRVVEDQQVTRIQKVGQVCDPVTGQARLRHPQQARGFARLGRALGDETLGKLVIEIAETHDGALPSSFGRPRVASRSAGRGACPSAAPE